MRVALYARVSTKRKGAVVSEYEQNPLVQLEPMRKYCEAQGWEIVKDRGPYEDPEVTDYFDRRSGVDRTRPAFGRLMQDAAKKRFDVVMVWKFDRMGRDTVHLIQTVDALDAAGVKFVSLTEKLDTTAPLGRMMFTLIAALAQFEREVIQERIQAGIAHAREKGVKFGRPRTRVPVGLIADDVDGGMTITESARNRGVNRETARRALVEYRAQKSVEEADRFPAKAGAHGGRKGPA